MYTNGIMLIRDGEKKIIMADHLDAPGLKPPNMDARVDICDIYAFQKPEDTNKSIFVLDVNPVAPTYADSFAPEAVYELKVDTNGDAVADIAYRFTFSPKEDGVQKAVVRRVSGEQARGNGNDGDVLFQDVSVSFGEEAITTPTASSGAGGEYRFFAGIRSDPFFFDLEGMKNNMQFTGVDTFLGMNVFSIILEIPNSALGSNSKTGIWYRVLIPKDGKPFFQIDRMGRPWVNIAFTKGEDKDTFNRIEPTRDRELFTKKFADLLESFGHSPERAHQTALTLLPDILGYDYSSSEGYPNGRRLTDDIIDIQLAVLTNGRVTTDKVGPHQDLLGTFPYLGSPHPVV
jgi:Domain of unknown function (DUF4331)